VIATVEEDDVWIADRNFCTLSFLSGIASHKGFFIIRDEIRGTYRGMMIAIPPQEWIVFDTMTLIELTKIL
jgi:hypothetical protein